MNPNDIPTEITRLIYDDPVHRGPRAISQNDIARVLAHYWPAIEKHVREQVARQIEQDQSPSPWHEAAHPRHGDDGQWIDSRDCTKAARIARGEQQ